MLNILKSALGIFLLFGATDIVGRVFWKEEDGYAGRWLCWLTAFFVFITPIFYLLNVCSLKINYLTISLVSAVIWLFISFVTRKKIFDFRKYQKNTLIIWIVIYFAIHAIFYSFYYTIPEWDSYSNILAVRNNLSSGSVISNYRPLFNASMTLVSAASSIDPYTSFPIFLLVCQTSLLTTTFLFRKKHNSTLISTLLIASAISVPVINLETDIPRPQSVLICLFPIFFYFLNRYFENNKYNYCFGIALWISLIGLSYHEFFLCLTFTMCVFIFAKLIQLCKSKDNKDKLIVLLSCLVGLSSILIGYQYSYTFRAIVGNFSTIVGGALNHLHLKIWFLNDALSADHLSTAWSGWKEILNYYSYYVSPIVFGLIVYIALKNDKKKKRPGLSLGLPIVMWVFFTFAEILPRLNIGILPERSWIFFDMSIILFTSLYITDSKTTKYLSVSLLICILISLFGSFFVAYNKKSLTSPEEMRAALWIKQSTAPNSLFVSQEANNKMIEFFGERKLLSPSSEYFLSDSLPDGKTSQICENIHSILQVDSAEKTIRNFDIENGDPKTLINSINSARLKIKEYKSSCYPSAIFTSTPMYVLYSYDKLESIYSSRQWWRDVNYFGADLNKFSNYPLVYDNGGVKIWRLR